MTTDEFMDALEKGALTVLKAGEERSAPVGGYVPGSLTPQDFDDGVVGRVHLAEEVQLTKEKANAIIEVPRQWLAQGDFRAAKVVFQAMTALAADPQFWVAVGVCDFRLKNWSEALTSSDRALALAPGDLDLQLFRAKALLPCKPTEGIAELKRLAQLTATEKEREIARQARDLGALLAKSAGQP